MAMMAAKGPIRVRASTTRRAMVAPPAASGGDMDRAGLVTMSRNRVSAVGASLVVPVSWGSG